MTTMDRMWAACAVLAVIAIATNIANWVFHAYIVVFVLLGIDLLVLAAWVRLVLVLRKEWRT